MSDDSSEQSTNAGHGKVFGWANRKKPRGQKNPPKSFGGLWRVVATAFSIFIIGQFAAVFMVGLGLGLINQDTDLLNILVNNTSVQFLYIFLVEAAVIGLVILVLRRRGLSLKSIGWGRRFRWQDLAIALITIVAFYILLIAATALVKFLLPEVNLEEPQDLGFKNLVGTADRLLAFSALVIMAPIGEEVLFRGYLYSGLRSQWQFFPAMALTSLLFGAAHLGSGNVNSLLWGAALTTFVLSIVLSYLRERTGALYAGMIVHGLNNAVAFAVIFRGALF